MPAPRSSVLDVVLVFAVVVIAAIVVWDRFAPDDDMTLAADSAQSIPESPQVTQLTDSDWISLLDASRAYSSENGSIRLVVFSDFECPGCRDLHETLDKLQIEFGDSLSVRLIHFPLPYHRFAEPAAHVAECAAAQGAFRQMNDALFAQPDSFGLKPWSLYAVRSGLKDTSLFASCVQSRSHQAAIDRGKELGKHLGIRGTPSVAIEGMLLSGVPTFSELARRVRTATRLND